MPQKEIEIPKHKNVNRTPKKPFKGRMRAYHTLGEDTTESRSSSTSRSSSSLYSSSSSSYSRTSFSRSSDYSDTSDRKSKNSHTATNKQKKIDPIRQRAIPNLKLLSKMIENNIQTNQRMDNDDLRRAEAALRSIDTGKRKVRLMTEFLTGKPESEAPNVKPKKIHEAFL